MQSAQLRDHPFFASLEEAHASEIIASGKIREYNKGDMLFFYGGDIRSFYIVTFGWVKLFRETFDGQEAVLAMATEGDVVGEFNFENKEYPFGAQAVSKTAVFQVPREKIRGMMERDGRVALKIVNSLSAFISKLESQVEHSSTMSTARRISYFIVELCGEVEKGPVSIKLPFEKTVIAAYLGMERETFSRGLRSIKHLGVRVKGNTVSVDEIGRLIDFSYAHCGGDELWP